MSLKHIFLEIKFYPVGKLKLVRSSRSYKCGRSAALSSLLSNFTKVCYCAAPKLPTSKPEVLTLLSSQCVAATLGTRPLNLSHSLWSTTMKILVEKENIYFWRVMPTFT